MYVELALAVEVLSVVSSSHTLSPHFPQITVKLEMSEGRKLEVSRSVSSKQIGQETELHHTTSTSQFPTRHLHGATLYLYFSACFMLLLAVVLRW